MPYNKLTKEEKQIIENRETEKPFFGEYDDFFMDGTFICRKCNIPLFSSKSKFEANCGWPAFDENYPNSISRILDSDGQRTEITCSNCKAHLGHVFEGEKLTNRNTRYCVNSLSIKFIPLKNKVPAILNE